METQIQKKMHYFKCVDCLTPVSVYERKPEMTCECGGTTFEWMGQVQGDQAVKEEERCKCNSLCTFAAGPRCDCVCCGRNHGLGMLAFETVDVVTGKVNFKAKCKDKNKAHAEWYRGIKAKQADLSIYGKFAEVKKLMAQGSNAVEWDQMRVIWSVDRYFNEFKKARTIKKRTEMAKKIETITA